MNEPQFSDEYLEMVDRMDSGDPPETPAKEPPSSGSERRLVRPSHGGYVGHVIVKVLCESRRWMQGSAITESDSMSEGAEKQRRYDEINAPFNEANYQEVAGEALPPSIGSTQRITP